MAQNEMKAKPALPERVRSMEGLGVWCMTDGFDVVPIWPDDECTVVVGVVLRPQPRAAVIFTTSSKRCSVELPDLFSAGCCKGNVYWPRTSTKGPKPEVSLALPTDHGPAFAF